MSSAGETTAGDRAGTVDVVIVNWNTSTAALAAAEAYAASEGVEVRVVIFDNASEADQRLILEGAPPEISVVLSQENLGFGTAANRALEQGSSAYVLVSNADVLPDRTAVREMVAAFDSIPNCGAVAPVIDDGNDYHDQLPGPLTLLMRIPIGSFNRKPVGAPAQGEIAEVGQPAGACFLTSRAVWERLGGFDERFFLWYEDVDLAKRLEGLGRTSIIAGSARVRHSGGESFLRLPARTKQAIRLDSLSLYLSLHHRPTYIISRPLEWATRRLRSDRQG